MSVKVQGAEEVAKNMAKLSKKYSESVTKALIKSGHLVRTEAIKSIQDKSQGKTVTKYRDGKSYKHTQGAKDEAPNTDTGALVKSIQIEIKPEGVYVGSSLDYAKHLEFGNHPFLIPALHRNKKKITKLISFAVKETKK